mgnify:FL=1
MQEHLHNDEDLPLRTLIAYVKSWKVRLFCVATSICNEKTTITRQWRHRCAWKLITTLREHWNLLTAKTVIKLRPNKSMKTRLVTMHSCSRENDDKSLPWNSKITTYSVAPIWWITLMSLTTQSVLLSHGEQSKQATYQLHQYNNKTWAVGRPKDQLTNSFEILKQTVGYTLHIPWLF